MLPARHLGTAKPSSQLLAAAAAEPQGVLKNLRRSLAGLSAVEAARRLEQDGPNRLRRFTWLMISLTVVMTALVILVSGGASSNFGNMLSMLGASWFLPYLPMTPLQILVNNLLDDLSQAPIPTDSVDDEAIAHPRPWSLG